MSHQEEGLSNPFFSPILYFHPFCRNNSFHELAMATRKNEVMIKNAITKSSETGIVELISDDEQSSSSTKITQTRLNTEGGIAGKQLSTKDSERFFQSSGTGSTDAAEVFSIRKTKILKTKEGVFSSHPHIEVGKDLTENNQDVSLILSLSHLYCILLLSTNLVILLLFHQFSIL